MSYIYCYTNKKTGRTYVGLTNNIERRKREHHSHAFNPNSKEYDYLFHKKLREYGEENFTFSILEETTDDKIKEAECFWIKKMHSHVSENGYNLTWGGDNNNSAYYDKDIDNIKKDIKQGISFDKIHKKYGISIPHISAINHGTYYHDDNEKYPLYQYYKNKEEINYIKDLIKNAPKTLKEIAEETGMSYSTIKKINSGALSHDNNEDYPLRKKDLKALRADKIKQMLLNNCSNNEIIIATGVSESTIKRINNGITHHDDNLIYPLRNL